MEVAWIWLDETRDSKKEAFDVLLGRLRGFDVLYPGLLYQIKITTTPNGFDWIYEYFGSPNKLPGTKIITTSTWDNPFIPEAYVKGLEELYNNKQYAQQEIEGQFVNITAGRVFQFNRNVHVSPCELNREFPLVFSMDFNVSPLCGVILQYNIKNKAIQVLDEIFIKDNGQTRDACKEFKRRYGDKQFLWLEYDGDISGVARDTASESTDVSIMDEELSSLPRAQNCIRLRRDRDVYNGVMAVNILLAPKIGKSLFRISPKCVNTIQDLEQLSWQPGTRKVEKNKNKFISHLSDALREVVVRLFPVGRDILPASAYEQIGPKSSLNELQRKFLNQS